MALPSELRDSKILQAVLRTKVGALPLPLFAAIALVLSGAAWTDKLPADMIGGFAAIMVIGMLLGSIGAHIPILKNIGGSAILCLFVPSALIGYKLLNPAIYNAIFAVMKTSNFLYLYIACLVTGSMLGMDRTVLVKGFLRMFVPVVLGTVAAISVGVSLAMLFGYTAKHAFFYIVMPIVAGGIGEGILPLSLAYAEILKVEQPALIASLIPAALIGNVIAIMASGVLKRLGERYPQYSGNGVLVRTAGNDDTYEKPVEQAIDLSLMGAGLLMACTMYVLGVFLSPLVGIPGPIVMILFTAFLKVMRVIPARMELGAYQMYRFIATNMTFPLLIGLGALYVPWNDLVAGLTLPYFVICSGTVIAMVASGWFVAPFLDMYPVESAIVTACHSGLGGTGDVAILSASNRMELMPFAQICTRIGGALMVVLAVFALKLFH